MPMWAALVLSVLAHAGVAAGFLGVPREGGRASALPDAMTNPPEKPPPQLGVEESRTATMTWIGYEEYERHVARQSEVDQAAFEIGGPGAPVPPAPQSQPVDAETIREAVAEGRRAALEPLRELAEAASSAARAFREVLSAPADWSEDADFALSERRSLSETIDRRDEGEEVEESPSSGGAASAPPSGAQSPAQKTGNSPDKEAIATSTVRASELRAGKPVAAQGLEIKTRRPEFDKVPLLNVLVRNPVVEVTFDHTGAVADARIVQSSGDPGGIDRPVLDAVYFWKARGKPLEALGEATPPGRITIRFDILLRQ